MRNKTKSINKKTILAVVVVILMAICFIVGNLAYIDAPTNFKPESNPVVTSSRELLLFDSDKQLTQDQATSRIKAKYLKETGGYRKDDPVVAIINLDGEAIIDSYLKDESLSDMTVGEYAATMTGEAKARSLTTKQNALIKKLESNALINEVSYRYTTIMNAVSVTVPYGNISIIEKMEGVKSVILSDTYNLPQTTSTGKNDGINTVVNDVDVYEDTGIFNSSSVSEFGITGKGTAVAVLDSGFDCSHEVFARQPEGELWITQDDVREAVANPELNAAKTTAGLKMTDVWYSSKIPFAYDYGDHDFDVFPYDSEHGTHVAGIIGGSSDTITGVAVDTQLVLMKVFSDYKSGAETEDILAAVEDSVLLGVDCINMSLGTSCGFAREEDGSFENEVYDKVKASGISLVVAASNSYSASFGGDQGNTNFVWNPDAGTVGSPSTYEAALSVASISGVKSSYLYANGSDVVFFTESSSITGKRNHFIDELYEQQNLDDDELKEYEYVTVPGYGSRDNYYDVDVSGKIALVKRGTTSFEDKALRAKNAGAVACIIYNNIEGTISMSMGKTDHIPTVSITKEMGEMLASHPTGTIAVSKKYVAGPFMSDFSSWGPSPNLELKPEITAHGGEIKSSIPGGGYDNLSGTSMASPNMCGVIVLIRQFLKDRFPDYTQQQIVVLANQMLMSTATIVLDEQGNPYSPRKQGAGLASMGSVVTTKAYISVDGCDKTKLELLDDPQKTGKYNMNFNVVNFSDADAEYNISVIGMTETVSTSDNEHVAEKGTLLNGKFTARIDGNGTLRGNKLKVMAGETVKVSLDYSLSSADKKSMDSKFPNGMYVEGFVKLTATTSEDVDLNVPFLAFYGDWTRAPIFDKTYYEVESEAHDGSIDDEDKIKADYYATTPYGSYYYNYVIPLGTYLYNIPYGYDAIPAVEEHIAVGETLAAVDGFYAVYAGALRNCKTMTYTIVDKMTGEVVKEFVDYNVLKSFSNGGTPLPSLEILEWRSEDFGFINNRQYEFKMVGLLDYGDGGLTTNLNNTFKFDFTFDNEAPVIKSVVYEKEYDRSTKKDRYYLTVTVYDNHYVQSITPIIFTAQDDYSMLTDDPIPVYSEKGKDNKVRFEITDMLKDRVYDALLTSALGFTVDDYALNTNVYFCQLPGTNGKLEFTANGEPDGQKKSMLSIYEDEVVDLTQYLSTTDPAVDADKDYLKYLDWKSSNTNIAQVQLGQVRGISEGRANVTVTDYLYGESKTIIISVKKRPNAQSDEAQEQSLGEADVKNAKIELKSTNDVADATAAEIEELRFSHFDTVYAYPRAGQRSMIGDTGDKQFINSFSGRLEMYPGEKIKLHYEISPWYVTEKYPATYATSDPTIATVDQEGNIVALKKGSVTITLTLAGSNLMARLPMTINSEFIINDSRTLVAYKGLGGDVVIPADEGIMYIGPYAFSLYNLDDKIKLTEEDYDANKLPQFNTTVTSVTIPDGVEEIQKYAFYRCTALKSVEIKGHVKYIRDYAFAGSTSLEEINLDNVYGIGRYAFSGCSSLDNIKLKQTYAIGERGFEKCTSLSSLDLTALRNTGVAAFSGCTSLTTVKLTDHTKLAVKMFENCGLTSADIYEKIEIPEQCFAACDDLESVTLHNSLVAVGVGAFADCTKLTSFTFGGSAQRIDDSAFDGCVSLTQFTLPNSEVVLGADVFYGCDKLTEIIIGKNTVISNIAASLFEGSDLTTITVDGDNSVYMVSSDNSLLLTKSDGSTDFDTIVFATQGFSGAYTVSDVYKYIAAGAFGGTQITELIITNPETVIGDYAFYSCTLLESVQLPEAVNGKHVKIGERAFGDCKALTSIDNLDSVTEIGDYAFANTGLTSATVGADAVCGEGAFFRSKLASVTIGANAKFGMGAFQSCTSLKTVNMPQNGGVHFGVACFSGDTALKTIDLSTLDEIEDGTFDGCTALKTAVLTNVEHIGDYAFAECSALETVEFPKVITIGEGAFCSYLTDDKENPIGAAPVIRTITLPATLTSLGIYAFDRCERLTTVIINSSIQEIPEGAFDACLALQSVTLPGTVKAIGDYAFCNDSNLTTINLGRVESVGDGAFAYTTRLASVDLSSLKTVGDLGFAGSGITGDITANKLEIAGHQSFQKAVGGTSIGSFTAKNLKTIGVSAFQDNTELTEFVFSNEVQSIGNGAFYGCTKLVSFYYLDDGEKVADGKINDYAELVEGVLYVRLDNGDLMLSSIPSGATVSTFVLKERTTVIAEHAANGNKAIRNVVLADSLRSIGNFAFAGCTSLESVEFRSFTAPTLENYYVSTTDRDGNTIYDNVLIAGDPGYDIIFNQYTWMPEPLCYYNFIGLVGKYRPIKMILPSNVGVIGYDSLIYEVYFGQQSKAEISNYIAMDENLAAFIDGAKAISRIEAVLLSDEKLVNDTISALEGTSMKGTDYGYTLDEWNALVDAVYSAKEKIDAFKGVKPVEPSKPTPKNSTGSFAIAVIVVCSVIIVAAFVAIALIFIKKKKAGKK